MRKKAIVFLAMAVMLMMICTSLLAGCGDSEEATGATDEYAPDYLVLVNKEQPISEDYVDTIKLVKIKKADGNYYEVEKTTKAAFQELRDALKEKDVIIGVDSAYRSVERQQEIMDEFIEEYGEEYAKATVAQPGTSEHHTGLAIDIVPKVNGEWVFENEDMLKEKEIFKVIHETLPDYGFILRYPEGKEDITGYDYEPWHLRYVGKEAAKEIYDKQITLDEYLK